MQYHFDYKHIFCPGWVVLCLIILYMGILLSLPASKNPNDPHYVYSGYMDGKDVIQLVVIAIVCYIVWLGFKRLYANYSFIEIKDGQISLVEFNKVRWNIPVSFIQSIMPQQGYRSMEADKLFAFFFLFSRKYAPSSGPMIGFSFSSENKTFYVKSFISDYDLFKKELKGINPNIKIAEPPTLNSTKKESVMVFMTKPVMYVIFLGALGLFGWMIFSIIHGIINGQ